MTHLCWHCSEETADVCMCCRLPVCYRCGLGPRFRRGAAALRAAGRHEGAAVQNPADAGAYAGASSAAYPA